MNAFAMQLVAIRDSAIETGIALVNGDIRGPSGGRWRSALKGIDIEAISTTIIPDIVDETIHNLLAAISSGTIELYMKVQPGDRMELLADVGNWELDGSYMGEWRQRFSAYPPTD